MKLDGGSYRDVAGRIYHSNGKIFRTISNYGVKNYQAIRDAGLLDDLQAKGFIVASRELSKQQQTKLGGDALQAAFVLEHERIPYISYPYEWSFEQLKAAALHHLDLQLYCFDKKFVLTDATAYNMQFIGGRPIFIDALSFKPYQQGEFWQGQGQFSMQFLYPLLLWMKLGIPYHSFVKGNLEGISALDLSAMLRLKHKFSLNMLFHLVIPAKLERQAINQPDKMIDSAKRKKELRPQNYRNFLLSMRHWIAKFNNPQQKTTWSDYEIEQVYDNTELQAKRDFVKKFVQKTKPKMLFDIGCNLGGYSVLARESGAEYVVGFDFDAGAIDVAYQRSQQVDNMLPLLFDAANPSPSLGWFENERKSFLARADADALVALAFEHHLVIAKNIPMEDFMDWLMKLARQGVVEFVPINDETIVKMLATRENIFPDYTQKAFEDLLSSRAKIIDKQVVSASGRILYWYERTS